MSLRIQLYIPMLHNLLSGLLLSFTVLLCEKIIVHMLASGVPEHSNFRTFCELNVTCVYVVLSNRINAYRLAN